MTQPVGNAVEKVVGSFIKSVGYNVDPQLPFRSTNSGNERGVQTARLDFRAFCQALMRYKHKAKESIFVKEQLKLVQREAAKPDATPRDICNCLLQCFVCSFLGYRVDFAHILAVNLAQQGTLPQKRLGYLCTKLFLRPGDPMRVLVVNSVLRDVLSRSESVITTGLGAAPELIDKEMIPAVLPAVMKRLMHFHPGVRKRAAVCLHSFAVMSREGGETLCVVNESLALLADKDWSVVWAAVPLLRETYLQSPDPEYLERIVTTLVQRLSDLIHGSSGTKSIPMYMEMRMPWLQIELIRTLGLCIECDRGLSHLTYKIFAETMELFSGRRQFIAVAILEECVAAICRIEPTEQLIGAAVDVASRLLSINNRPVKYSGLQMFFHLTSIRPSLLIPHQVAIVECLKDSDNMIRNAAFRLLFNIANSANVEAIVTSACQSAERYPLSPSVFSAMVEVATKHATSAVWLLKTLRTLFTMRDNSKSDLSAPLQRGNYVIDRLISRLSSEKGKDEKMWSEFVQSAWGFLSDANVPPQLLLLCIWAVVDNWETLGQESEILVRQVATATQNLTRNCRKTLSLKSSSLSSQDPTSVDLQCHALILLRRLVGLVHRKYGYVVGEELMLSMGSHDKDVGAAEDRISGPSAVLIESQIFKEIENLQRFEVLVDDSATSAFSSKDACAAIRAYTLSRENDPSCRARKASLTNGEQPGLKSSRLSSAESGLSNARSSAQKILVPKNTSHRLWSSEGLQTKTTDGQVTSADGQEIEETVEMEAAAIFAGVGSSQRDL